jgi:type IV secretory pathway TraG/TraD family ATPase VirD4
MGKIMNKDNGTFIGLSGTKRICTPDNAKHIFVCGTTGSGKTVVLSNYIKQALEKNYPLLLVDGKGDVGSGSLLDIVRRLHSSKHGSSSHNSAHNLGHTENKPSRKLYVMNFTTPEVSDLYNPFRDTTPTVAKDMLVNLTNWNEEYYKLNTERYLQRVVLLLIKANISLSFKNIVRHMSVKRFTELSGELVKSGTIEKDDHADNLEIATTSGKVSENSVARFSLITESELGHIFDGNGVDIYAAMRERATILFVLNPLTYPELSPLLGRLILIDCKKAVSKLFTENLGRSFFIFDENVYASKALIDLVNKSRSADVTCILATQSLSDLSSAEDENFKEQVVENCNNYIVLRQNSAVNSENWASILGTRNTMEVTYQMEHRDGATVDTGLGSARLVREFIYHPDDIKSLRPGQAFFLSRDSGQHSKVQIHKPF